MQRPQDQETLLLSIQVICNYFSQDISPPDLFFLSNSSDVRANQGVLPSAGKVMFLPVSVILFKGKGMGRVHPVCGPVRQVLFRSCLRRG